MRHALHASARALAATGAGLALGLGFSGCLFDPAGLSPSYRPATVSATVRNLTDGRSAAFRYPNPTLDPATLDVGLNFPESESEADARSWVKRYLHRRLAERSASPSAEFWSMFGSGSEWCLVEEPNIALGAVTEGEGRLRDDVSTMEPELAICPSGVSPMPEECQNPPGMAPSLSLTTPYDFGTVPIGLDSGWRDIELTNTATATGRLCLVFPNLRTNPEYATEPGTCAPDPANEEEAHAGRRLLEPGQACTGRVRFQPNTQGASTATLPVISNDPAAGITSLVLRGFGVGGLLSVSAIDAPGTISDPGGAGGPATVCIAPYGADPTHYRPYILFRNDGPGIVSISSLPSDDAWPLVDYYILDIAGGLRRPPGAEAPPNVPTVPVVLGVGEQLRFGGSAGVSAATPPARLDFYGNQQNNPFTIAIVPSAACP